MKRPTLSEFLRRCRIQDQTRGRVIPRWAPWLLIGCTLALVPWTVLLFFTLPEEHVAQHWDLAWAGFDVGITLALALTAASVLRRSVWTSVTASMAGTLLLVDAWFDILTAHGARERWIAVGMAVFCELPLAAICLSIARNVERVLEQARRYVLAAGYTVEGRSLVPPRPVPIEEGDATPAQ
ncbi:MAG: hypothetical protein JWM31_1044 [Solirubrobacterales bacterium]|nr:hypothetical protein [Solirubrobacterales bacterium]